MKKFKNLHLSKNRFEPVESHQCNGCLRIRCNVIGIRNEFPRESRRDIPHYQILLYKHKFHLRLPIGGNLKDNSGILKPKKEQFNLSVMYSLPVSMKDLSAVA